MTQPEPKKEKSTVPAEALDKIRKAEPSLHVAPSPHISNQAITTRGMMYDVVIGLVPVIAAAVIFFGWYAVVQITLAVLTCLATEWVCERMRGRKATLTDGSAAVTGVILALSLPWSVPWHVTVLGSVMAIGLGKAIFGGLGYNIFNPAMVGRAFITLAFALQMSASSYVSSNVTLDIVTQATPLTAIKMGQGSSPTLMVMFMGSHNGSLGETSILACLIGGLYLCVRRSASWEIPVTVILSAAVFGGLLNAMGATPLTVLHHLTGGALIFGAFFIATDPVSSPLTPKGKVIYGIGIGFFIVLIRVFSSYAEGVMFAVLLMNAATPLLNRWTIPKPLGYVAPIKEKAANA